jgi:nucleoside 2-deoxyribosyltransferase
VAHTKPRRVPLGCPAKRTEARSQIQDEMAKKRADRVGVARNASKGLWLPRGPMGTVKTARRATVSGSFRRAMRQVQEAVYALTDMGVTVLSPADPRVVDKLDSFLFVASDKLRSVRLVQQRHLMAIGESDFLWLVAPDGYVGTSAAMEIGYAVARHIPVFCTNVPADLTLREFVTVVPAMQQALARTRPSTRTPGELALLDPGTAVDEAHEGLERLHAILGGKSADRSLDAWQRNVADLLEVSTHL